MDYNMESLPEQAEYMFELPPELVAQHPPERRGESRLMVLGRNQASPPALGCFEDLPAKLPKNSLLVINEVRVSQARLWENEEMGKDK